MSGAASQLQVLEQQLDSYFCHHAAATEQLADWLVATFTSNHVVALLDGIMADATQLAAISQRSYLHGNGFLKVVLLDKGYKLRLHIWHKGQSCEENIHDHRWSFASTVITGMLRSQIWCDAVVADSDTFQLSEYRYHAASYGQPARLTEKGISLLRLEKQMAISAGQAYIMPEQQLHCINNPGDQMLATLVCTVPTAQGTTRLIKTRDIQPEVTPPRLHPGQLRSELQRFLALYQHEVHV